MVKFKYCKYYIKCAETRQGKISYMKRITAACKYE